MKTVKLILGLLLFIVALNAFAGGIYGITGAKTVPIEWLANTPFKSYFFPGFILFFLVGAPCFISAFVILKGAKHAITAGYSSGAIIMVWLSVQLAMIGYVSWLQPVTASLALLILILTRVLSNYEY